MNHLNELEGVIRELLLIRVTIICFGFGIMTMILIVILAINQK